ncbi:dnc [Symbiodinium sp. CCMP2592]|nr:dnc [Symbiodinium sp. CCMP2592]
MAALAWLLFSLAAAVVDAGHLRGLRGLSEDLGTILRADVAKAASAFFKTFQIEGNQGGAPAASIDTTASGAHLVQELLSNKELTDEIMLKPTRNGWVQSGRLYDILMKDAHVGKETHVSTEGGQVKFSVEDLSVDVECQYDLRLSSFRYKETGKVRARLFGDSMLLNFPVEGSGPGGCHFGEGLDLEVLNATSDHDALNVAITDILSNNMLDLRTEIVQEMESGLCRNLLEPRAQQPKFMHQALGNGESMWPLVLGAIFISFAMLVVAFIAGRQSVYLGFCGCFSSCCGPSTSPWSQTEGHTSSEESQSDIENNLLGLSNMTEAMQIQYVYTKGDLKMSDGLIYAVSEKPLGVVKELIRGGANPFVQDSDGRTCMELAEERGDQAVMDCLQHYIAELERSRSRHLKSKPFSADRGWPTVRALEQSQWLASGHSKSELQETNVNIILPLDRPPAEPTPAAQLVRLQVKMLLDNPVFQAVLTTNLVLALFLPDFWVILAMQARTALDVALVLIFTTFAIEFGAHVIAFPDTYIGSYTFWTDIISMLSVPLDFSVVADNFVGLFEGSGLARVTKFAKLSARAVRLSRLTKLLRFLPGSRKQLEMERSRQGPAKEISLELMADLSLKVAMLIIGLVLVLPLLDFFKYPPDDNSMATWTSQLYWTSKTHPEDAMAVIEDMRQFYSVLEYHPFQVMYSINNTQISHESRSAASAPAGQFI